MADRLSEFQSGASHSVSVDPDDVDIEMRGASTGNEVCQTALLIWYFSHNCML